MATTLTATGITYPDGSTQAVFPAGPGDIAGYRLAMPTASTAGATLSYLNGTSFAGSALAYDVRTTGGNIAHTCIRVTGNPASFPAGYTYSTLSGTYQSMGSATIYVSLVSGTYYTWYVLSLFQRTA